MHGAARMGNCTDAISEGHPRTCGESSASPLKLSVVSREVAALAQPLAGIFGRRRVRCLRARARLVGVVLRHKTNAMKLKGFGRVAESRNLPRIVKRVQSDRLLRWETITSLDHSAPQKGDEWRKQRFRRKERAKEKMLTFNSTQAGYLCGIS